MGQVFSSNRPRQASGLGTESGERLRIEINEPSERRSIIDIPNHGTIHAHENGEHESRTRGVEPCCSGSPRPESTRALLSPSLIGNYDGTAVASDAPAPGSPRQAFLEHRRHSRSSFAMSDTETVTHPETKRPVYRRGSVRNRPALKIIDDSLIEALSESGSALMDSPVYEGMYLSTTHIHEPYEALFYSRKRIVDVAATHVEEIQKHAQLLLAFMKNDLANTWAKCLEIDDGICQHISFENLWLLYPPGETVFRNAEGGWRAYKVARVETGANPGQDPIRIYGYYLGFDKTGRSLVPHLELLRVDPYISEKPVGSLEVIPEWYVERYMKGLPNALMARGETYWKYRGKPFYQGNRGDAWPLTSSNNRCKVIIDHATSSRHDADVQPGRSVPLYCFVCLAEDLELGPWFENSDQMLHDPDMCKKDPESAMSVNADIGRLLLYCPSMVWAFSLEHMSWKKVSLNTLYPLKSNEENWCRLWLSGEAKTQIDSLASAHFGEWETRQNLGNGGGHVEAYPFGRRRGRNLHFHGGTGTGKTFTAECLAEKHGRPLYRVACGSMGTEPSIFEHRLREVLVRAANWGAILLLENSDLFVQEFDLHNLARNSLNSILIHHLDLSDAFVILTTGRTSRLHECFQSRISFQLLSGPLTFRCQQDIWRKLLNRLGLDQTSLSRCQDFIDSELEGLGGGEHQQMNGWQIEKCLDAALALANMEGRGDGEVIALTEGHIKTVLRLGREFRERLGKLEDPVAWMRSPPEAIASKG